MFKPLLMCCLIAKLYASPIAIELKDEDVALKPFELDEVVGSSLFSFKSFNGSWISDSEFTYRNLDNDVNIYNVATDTHSLLLSNETLADLKVSTFALSPDRTQLLIRYDVKTVFRHSTTSKFKIYNFATKAVTDIAEGEDLQKCIWAPIGSGLGYVVGNNVYYRKPTGEEIQLTFDGVIGVIYNGIPDWVYEEEIFGTDDGLWFSPDATKLVMASFNDTKVETFTYHLYGEPGSLETQYPVAIDLKYPKVGTTNPDVKVSVLDLLSIGGSVIWKTISAPIEKVSEDHILSSIVWASDQSLLVTWSNRRQNVVQTQVCDFDTTKCSDVISFEEPNGWVDTVEPVCSKDANKCFFFKHLNGWYGIISVDLGTLAVTEVSGEFTALSIKGYNADKGQLYYSATIKDHPEYSHIYKNKECLSCGVKSPEDTLCTYASATFSESYSYYALVCSGPAPSFTSIYKTETKTEVKKWQENLEKRALLAEYQKINIKYLRVPVADNFEASVKLYLPEEIGFETTTTKYPMILYIYGGPNSVRVIDTYTVGFQNYLVTNRKIIYCLVDVRGSGNKGTDMLFKINNVMGSVEIEDFISVTRYLRDNYKFIDEKRIGIWGWSYGGYATSLTITRDTDHVFQGGISVAPVTSWIYYDSMYTERYMGVPTEEDNLEGYTAGDVNQQLEGFKTHHFFLIHGNGDDNVHYQHSMALSRALQQADIIFEQMSYPDEAHALSGVLPHLYKTMDDFWTKCLDLEEP